MCRETAIRKIKVRFSAVHRMERYISAIQDAFRRTGFPIERATKVRQVTFVPEATAPVEMVERQRWEYRNREETWSDLGTEDDVILQTTAYTRFEESPSGCGLPSTQCWPSPNMTGSA